MERKSKYSLFPTRPSSPPREPLPLLPERNSPSHSQEEAHPLQESPTIPPEELLLRQPKDRPSTAPASASPSSPREPLAPPAEEPPCPWPPLNNSWSPREETTSTLNETSPPGEEILPKRKMHAPSSSTSSESSLHKPMTTGHHAPPPNPRNRPRTVYFHSGIGGAGNYHKAIREDNVLRPMASSRANHPRFLSSLFGTLGGKKGRRHQQQSAGSDEPESPQSGSQTLPLGAAEVMRRKMLGITSDGRSKESCTRG